MPEDEAADWRVDGTSASKLLGEVSHLRAYDVHPSEPIHSWIRENRGRLDVSRTYAALAFAMAKAALTQWS